MYRIIININKIFIQIYLIEIFKIEFPSGNSFKMLAKLANITRHCIAFLLDIFA